MQVTTLNDKNGITVSEINTTTYSISYDLSTSRDTGINLYYTYSKGQETQLDLTFKVQEPDFGDTDFKVKVLDDSNVAIDYKVTLNATANGRIPIPTSKTENKIIIIVTATGTFDGDLSVGLKADDSLFRRNISMK